MSLGNGASCTNEEILPRDATGGEIESLVHEPDKIPITAWLLTFTESSSTTCPLWSSSYMP
jgi:hypothetical protein